MSFKAVLSALLTVLVTGGTSLMTVFAQDGVSNFGDISQTAYATVAIGALVAGIKAYQDKMSLPPGQKR